MHYQALVLAVALSSNACMMALYLLGEDDGHATLYKMCALVGKAAANAGTYVIQILTAELYPTCVRCVLQTTSTPLQFKEKNEQ